MYLEPKFREAVGEAASFTLEKLLSELEICQNSDNVEAIEDDIRDKIENTLYILSTGEYEEYFTFLERYNKYNSSSRTSKVLSFLESIEDSHFKLSELYERAIEMISKSRFINLVEFTHIIYTKSDKDLFLSFIRKHPDNIVGPCHSIYIDLFNSIYHCELILPYKITAMKTIYVPNNKRLEKDMLFSTDDFIQVAIPGQKFVYDKENNLYRYIGSTKDCNKIISGLDITKINFIKNHFIINEWRNCND